MCVAVFLKNRACLSVIIPPLNKKVCVVSAVKHPGPLLLVLIGLETVLVRGKEEGKTVRLQLTIIFLQLVSRLFFIFW